MTRPAGQHEGQYHAARDQVGLVDRSDRALIEIMGADRTVWLNNLVTNVVKTLSSGEGIYAFAVNVKGRVVFDANVLMLDPPAQPDGRIWLDLDAGWLADALKHLNRYIITEKVQLADVTARYDRLAILGPQAAALAQRLGLSNLIAMASLQHVPLQDGSGHVIRHDFAGVTGAEFIVPVDSADEWRARMMEAGREFGIDPIDASVVDTLRIEAGIPASRCDIDPETIPPETGQIERGISYHKGCYLGQEVIERMRSHGIIAKRLVGVRLEGETAPACPAAIKANDAESGRLTSVCWSYALSAILGLGYLKSSHASAGLAVTVAGESGPIGGQVVALPVRPAA